MGSVVSQLDVRIALFMLFDSLLSSSAAACESDCLRIFTAFFLALSCSALNWPPDGMCEIGPGLERREEL